MLEDWIKANRAASHESGETCCEWKSRILSDYSQARPPDATLRLPESKRLSLQNSFLPLFDVTLYPRASLLSQRPSLSYVCHTTFFSFLTSFWYLSFPKFYQGNEPSKRKKMVNKNETILMSRQIYQIYKTCMIRKCIKSKKCPPIFQYNFSCLWTSRRNISYLRDLLTLVWATLPR